MRGHKNKAGATFLLGACLLISSCGNVQTDSEIINVDLQSVNGLNWINCFHISEPKPMDAKEPHFNQCLSADYDRDTIMAFSSKIAEDLKVNGWGLSNSIEDTDIYNTIRAYDKCRFAIHISTEPPEYAHEYFDMKTEKPVYKNKTHALIITRFTEKYCS